MRVVKSVYVESMRVLRKVASAIGLLKLLESKRSYFGCLWLRSMFSIYDFEDLSKLDLPWWTFSAIKEVEQFISSRQGRIKVFEFGSGASSVWLARRCQNVITVEHDSAFAKQVAELTSGHFPNLTINCVPPVAMENPSCKSGLPHFSGCDFSNYSESIKRFTESGPFDLIVVDGRVRVECLHNATGLLAKDGMLVFDDSHRSRYAAGFTRWNGGIKRCAGIKPCVPFPSETALLTR